LGFAVASQLAARTRPHCQFVFLRSKVCYALLSASPRAYALRFATVAVIGSGWFLSSNKTLPMLGTLAHALLRAVVVPRIETRSGRAAERTVHWNPKEPAAQVPQRGFAANCCSG
jgi:hypothetical protein